MPPKRKLITRQGRAKENRLKITPKNQEPDFPPTNTQSPAAHSQDLITRPWTRTQKRKHEAKDDHSPKRIQRDPPSALILATDSKDENLDKGYRRFVPQSQLSKENLKKLQRGLEKLERDTSEKMDSVVTTSDRVQKRTPSRQASFSDLNLDAASARSQKSSVSNSFYRYHILDYANIYVRPEPPPKEIRSQLDIIFKRKGSEKRRREIPSIAKKISQKFIYNLRGAQREDDLVELIYEAFLEMFKGEAFDCPRKADWDPSLKPDFQQEIWDRNALSRAHEAHNIVDRPSKRQQGDWSLPSPDASRSTMPPPMPPPPAVPPVAPCQSKQEGTVKTPRPDFTVGLRHSTVADALMERGLSKYKANDFLKFLQRTQRLCSDPTQNFLNVRFPILVIEGKAYATGKTAFEAENQAAVSGSCMVNLQRQLSDLFDGVFPHSTGSPHPESRKTPLAFSICTQGPVIEFWVHYFVVEENNCMYYMNLLNLYHGSLHEGLEDFLMQLEHLMSWYKGAFLKEVADQLFDLANHTARS